MGTVCTNWGPGLNWMEPVPPPPPPVSSALAPNPPSPPPTPGIQCSCNNWLGREGEEIDTRSWQKVKSSYIIPFGEGQAAEAAAEYYGLTQLERALPPIELSHYGELMYDLWEIQEEVSAKYENCH
jgi:hypothetical protein